MAKRLLYPVNFRKPDSDEIVTLDRGELVPDWALPALDGHPDYTEDVDLDRHRKDLAKQLAAVEAQIKKEG